MFATPYGVSKLTAHGSLDLNQKENFARGMVERQIGFAPEDELSYRLRTENIWNVLTSRFNQNTTVDYTVHNTYLTTTQQSESHVEIDLLLDVPVNQVIRYQPSFLEKTTTFWIQYLALLIPALYVNYYLILGNGFQLNIIQSTVRSEIKQA
jgi:hypothetical protein